MGYKISTIIATDGSLGGNNDDNKLIENRKKESQDGLNKLGIPLFLNLPDGSLGSETIHTTIIKDSIQKVNPDLIVTHYYKDYHSDHVNLSKIVKNEWDKIDKQIPNLEKEKLEFISTFPDELKDLYDNLKKRGLEVIAAYRNKNQCGCCGVELTSSEIEQILKTKFQQCSYCDGVII
jgi:LmbE family N-acetylglucosaminyl deacetylase